MSFRLSTYVIQVPTSIGTLLLYNSFTGGMDEVTGDLSRAILKARGNGEEIALATFRSSALDALLAQGHITRWTRQEELEHHSSHVRELRKDLESRYQVCLWFLLTYCCNMKCHYCSQRTIKERHAGGDHGIISPVFVDTVFAKTLPGMKNPRSLAKVVLIGGEPLQAANRPAIERILKHSSAHGAGVSATSNGYEADRFLGFFGKGPGKIEGLVCTLDGSARFHDRTRMLLDGKGSYAKIVANLLRIADLEVGIDININLTDKSSECLNELTDELKSVGLLGRSNVTLVGNPIKVSAMEASSTCLPNELSVWKLDQMLTQRGLGEQIMSPRKILKQRLRKEIFDHPYARPSCVCSCSISNPTNLVLDPYSDVYACYQEAGHLDKRIGTLRQDGSIDLFDRHRITADMQVDLAERCRECSIALICGGGCWAYQKSDDAHYQTFCLNMRKLFMNALLDLHSEMLAGSYENEKIVPYRYRDCDEIKGLWRASDSTAKQADLCY